MLDNIFIQNKSIMIFEKETSVHWKILQTWATFSLLKKKKVKSHLNKNLLKIMEFAKHYDFFDNYQS